MMKYGVLTFSSTHSAIRTEKFLKERFPIQIMPTPRAVTASCGISIRVAPDDLPGVLAAVAGLTDLDGCWAPFAVSEAGEVEPLS